MRLRSANRTYGLKFKGMRPIVANLILTLLMAFPEKHNAAKVFRLICLVSDLGLIGKELLIYIVEICSQLREYIFVRLSFGRFLAPRLLR